jgi:serine/threonine-protein kinase
MTCGAVYRAEFPHCVNDGAELVVMERDPLVGATIGFYVVDALLGEGGMGRVYRVHHARLPQKRFALKVLLGDFAATPPMRKRFAKEAQSASLLSHPNVVAVSDFGVTDAGLAYLAMDLVEGTPLSQLIGHQPMAPERVIHLARQLCMGLAHAHDLGLIHRDLKPANIIIVDGPSGEVPRIADFGLAITNDENDMRLTTSGVVMGTPAYIAPEQCTASAVDHRADLYALGATLFEALTGGILPFDGDPAMVVGLKVTTAAPKLAMRAPHVRVPPALAAIVSRLLARRPKDRFADARVVAAALEQAVRTPDDASIAGEQELAPGPRSATQLAVVEPQAPPPANRTPTERVRGVARSPRAVAIISGSIVLAGLMIAAVVWSTRTAAPATAPPPTAPPTATPRIASPPAASPPAASPPAASPPAAPPPAPPAPRPPAAAPPVRRPAAVPPPRPAARAPEPPPPPATLSLEPRVASVDVRGALPAAAVRRALDRVLPAARACRSDRAGSVDVQLTIGESRRAAGLRASGLAASSCLAGALSGLRTEAAPDTGDAEVRVRFTYEPPR